MLRIKREARIMKLLHHPHVVRLLDVFEEDKEIVLVMEYVPGGELFDHIVAQGKLRENDARRIFRHLISAIDYCHQNCIVHRDLKPENLLLDSEGKLKVADFGFSNMYDPEMSMHTFCGSPFYASPEMIVGQRYLGPEVDIWSMGVILFALLCGHLPFDEKDVRMLYENILAARYQIPGHVSAGLSVSCGL